MFNSGGSHQRRNDSMEAFVDQNLPRFQTRWLTKETEALCQTRAELLDAILSEWFALNPPEVWADMDEGEIVRRAVENSFLGTTMNS